MRTNIDINEELLKEAFKISPAKTKKELIHEALEEYVKTHKRMDLRKLKGKVQFQKDYNYKILRKGS